MRRNKTLDDCVRFANWCATQHQRPADIGDLITLAHRAHAAGERAANGEDSAAEDRTAERFASLASSLGYATEWYGL